MCNLTDDWIVTDMTLFVVAVVIVIVSTTSSTSGSSQCVLVVQTVVTKLLSDLLHVCRAFQTMGLMGYEWQKSPCCSLRLVGFANLVDEQHSFQSYGDPYMLPKLDDKH